VKTTAQAIGARTPRCGFISCIASRASRAFYEKTPVSKISFHTLNNPFRYRISGILIMATEEISFQPVMQEIPVSSPPAAKEGMESIFLANESLSTSAPVQATAAIPTGTASPEEEAPYQPQPTEEATNDEEEDTNSGSGNVLNWKKLKNGWSVFGSAAAKMYEEQVKPALAVASEKSAKTYEEQIKPALAVASEKSAKAWEEQVKPALAVASEKSAKAWEVTKEKTGEAWEVTKVKSAEAYAKAKPTLDKCSEQCDMGVKTLIASITGKPSPAVVGGASVSDDEGAPSSLESSTKGSFTI